jgi:ABC-type Fe3+/spermidine/putrescine transport system ATPase subunit
MPGLVPGIHDSGAARKTWMAGPRPAMTEVEQRVLPDLATATLKAQFLDHDLQLKGVGKVFDNGTVAVANFDLDVKKGEFIAFLGPSGCGKTTTLRMVAGFETATSGDILIRGKRVNDMPPERRPTSMIFQNYALFPHLSVRDNVGYGLDVKGMPAAERNQKVNRILDKLGLMDIADIRPSSLSRARGRARSAAA